MFKKMLSAGIMLAGLGMGTGLVLGGDKPANMMINPGAEDVVPRGEYKHIVLKGVPSTMLPPGWGAYAGGQADVKWGTDDASPHSGKRCLTATVLSPIEKGKGNFGLILCRNG